jgi:hypothetical protein
MEALLVELAKKYGMEKAMQILGLDQQSQNPKYAISIGERTVNPMNILARTGLNQIFKGSSAVGALPLLAGAVGLGYLTNPLREGSMNYNPYLQDQIDILGPGRVQNGKIVSGPLAGKNLVSMMGSNDYVDMLDNRIDYFQDRLDRGKKISDKNFRAVLQEKRDFEEQELQNELEQELQNKNKITQNLITQNNAYSGGDGGSFSTSQPGKEGAFGTFDGSKGRKDYGRGGIASL